MDMQKLSSRESPKVESKAGKENAQGVELEEMRLLSLFSGIGAFEKALENLGIQFDLVGYCEIDKYASKAYSLIHNVPEDMNLGDITKVDTAAIGNVDLITYGFPCQDISIAGKQKGFEDENGERTRSGLFFEALRIIEDTQPKFAICENVKALTSKKFAKEFQTVLDSLNDAGYVNYWKVLNAKDYGVPQNRERVFIVSIRKDIDKGFEFPKPIQLEKRLKDVLENEVDDKYYLSQEIQDRFQLTDETFAQNVVGTTKPDFRTIGQKDLVYQENSVMGSLVATDYKQPKQIAIEVDGTARIKQVGQMYPNSGNPQAGRVYDATGISPAMDTCSGGNRMPKIVDDTYRGREPRVYEEFSPAIRAERTGFKVVEPICAASRGRNPENPSDRTPGVPTVQRLEFNKNGTTNALTTVLKDNYIIEPVDEPNVLTPKRTEYGKAVRKQYEAGEIKESRHNMTEMVPRTDGVANTLTTVLKDNYVAEPIKVGNTSPSGRSQCNDVFATDGIYPNICAGTHGNCNPSILVREATKQGYAEAVEGDFVNLQYPDSKTRRGRVGKQIANTLMCNDGGGVVVSE